MSALIAVKAVVLDVHPRLAPQRSPAPLCAGAATLTACRTVLAPILTNLSRNVVIDRRLTEAQARALWLANNQIALNSGWEEALLPTEPVRILNEVSSTSTCSAFPGWNSISCSPSRMVATWTPPMKRQPRMMC